MCIFINLQVDPDVYKRMSTKEKEYAKKYVRFTVRGKLMRTVPVIIDKEVEECCLEILNHREEAGVPSNNDYLFGLPSNDRDRMKYMRSCGLLREFAEACGAEIPSTLRGTQLRKHVATTCLLKNLDDQFTSDLAKFMGHSKEIHHDHYRVPVAHKEILGITKLLECAQGAGDDEEHSDVEQEFDQIDQNLTGIENDFENLEHSDNSPEVPSKAKKSIARM